MDIFTFWSWGPAYFCTNEENTWLRFNVQGLIHTGWVWIFLSAADLYDVYLSDTEFVIKDSITGLYFDQLAVEICKRVEYNPTY